MTLTPDNWRPAGASDDPRWKIVWAYAVAVSSRTAVKSLANEAAEQEAVRTVNEMFAAYPIDPCPYCKHEMLGTDDCGNCGCGSPARPTRRWAKPSSDAAEGVLSTSDRGTKANPAGDVDPDRLFSSPSTKPAPDALREALTLALAELAEDRPSAGTVRAFVKWADRLLSRFDIKTREPAVGDKFDLPSGFKGNGTIIAISESSAVPSPDGAGESEALGYATRLLTSFVNEHFPHNPDWKPLPDLIGVLTQIDNAITIARDYKARLSPSATGAAEPDAVRMTDKITVADMERAAQICRTKYCEIMPGKRAWADLTKKEQEVDIVCLVAAFRSLPAPAVRVTREAAETIIKLAISDGEWLGHHTNLEPDEANRIRANAVTVRTDSILALSPAPDATVSPNNLGHRVVEFIDEHSPFGDHHGTDFKGRQFAMDALQAAALSDQVLVPKEPTPEMLDNAFVNGPLGMTGLDGSEQAERERATVAEIYKAMLTANATPPSKDNGPDTNGGET